MKRLFSFQSPLVMRPDARQPRYLLCCAVLYTVLAVLKTVQMLSDGIHLWLPSLITAALLLWLSFAVMRDGKKDVTAAIPPVVFIGAWQIVEKALMPVTNLPTKSSALMGDLFWLLAEGAFWVVFVLCFIRAICGKYKILLPMALLFFGFFYAFIKYDLRAFADILMRIFLLLCLWFPLDAVTFTSLYKKEEE